MRSLFFINFAPCSIKVCMKCKSYTKTTTECAAVLYVTKSKVNIDACFSTGHCSYKILSIFCINDNRLILIIQPSPNIKLCSLSSQMHAWTLYELSSKYNLLWIPLHILTKKKKLPLTFLINLRLMRSAVLVL